jgi:hypothetical protein
VWSARCSTSSASARWEHSISSIPPSPASPYNLALQQIVFQKQQQDAMKSAFRDSAGYESYYNANILIDS